MKKIILILLAISFSILSYAQEITDVVYLKNGSVLRGSVVEIVPNASYKLKTYDGNLWVFKAEEVQKIVKEEVETNSTKQSKQNKSAAHKYNASFNKNKGYMGLIEVGAFSSGKYGFTIINGYRILPQFAIGIGIGLQGFIPDKEMVFPVFLHLRSDFMDNNISPFVSFNVGYNASLLGGVCHGVTFEPGLGVGVNASDRYRLTMTLGCSVDHGVVYVSDSYYTSGLPVWLIGAMVKIGFSF